MKITNKVDVVSASLQKTDKIKENVAGGKAEKIAPRDQVTVSEKAKEKAKEIETLQAQVGTIPEVRTDRVEAVKKAINEGTYNVKGEAVAGKMIREAIIDSIV
ncbi:MAG: flagellar biosynthesis anti-sigma factor FlgM [Nitrospirota bacterium]